ncbi:MAG: hypothetical protein ACKOSS_05505 [Planctomycetia bacterium]
MHRTIPTLVTLSVLCLLAVLGASLLAARGTAQAEDERNGLRFISISGDGSNAKAWFEGAPASGMRVQEALDRFAREGYRFAGLQPSWRASQVQVSSGSSPASSTQGDATFVLVLERR